MGKYSIRLFAGNGEVVQHYIGADITQFPQANYPLTFKMKDETTEGRVVTREITTTLPAIIEEVTEHSGLFSV